jgi:phosphoserine / homoserine phosphotransferase
VVGMICLDLEGVLVPEIWIAVAERTGIADLRLTTRDVPDYDALMRHRLELLARHGLDLMAIQTVIAGLEPLPGARDFVDWARANHQLVILSDTFYEFAEPLMRQLGRPTLFCHRLLVDEAGRISGYRLRMADHKAAAVEAFRRLHFATLAAGDSYNDIRMLQAADHGILYAPPARVVADYPGLPVCDDHMALRDQVIEAFAAAGHALP